MTSFLYVFCMEYTISRCNLALIHVNESNCIKRGSITGYRFSVRSAYGHILSHSLLYAWIGVSRSFDVLVLSNNLESLKYSNRFFLFVCIEFQNRQPLFGINKFYWNDGWNLFYCHRKHIHTRSRFQTASQSRNTQQTAATSI